MICLYWAVLSQTHTVPTYKVLFLGNSHTANNDVPKMVMNIIESDNRRRSLKFEFKGGPTLESLAKSNEVKKLIQTGKFTDVVLQGASLSSSHKYRYSQEGAIALAKLADSTQAKVWHFAEWPRRNWKETPYILGIYQSISKTGGGKVIPICKVWDELLKHNPKLPLWSDDGNHASLLGSYTASLAIALAIDPSIKPAWKPQPVTSELNNTLLKTARSSGLPM